jgi:inhibitor of cysteine peptidase
MSVELSAADTGTRRTIQVGARVTVRLAETPTTGYRWQADDDPGLRLVDDRFEGAEVPRGAAGVRVLDFEAVHSGPARLRLAKRRAWGEPSQSRSTWWISMCSRRTASRDSRSRSEQRDRAGAARCGPGQRGGGSGA